MPCRDWDYDERIQAESLRSEIAALQAQLTKAPKPSLLCEAMTLLENHGLLEKVSNELRRWYADHESHEAHKVRLEAAEKLSERERRLLGIDINELRQKANK